MEWRCVCDSEDGQLRSQHQAYSETLNKKIMANIKTIIDEWSVRNLENNSSISVMVENCTELGNQSLPGIQVF